MNKAILLGRFTRDPAISAPQNEGQQTIARFALAVDRRVKKDTEGQTADFISCVAFGKTADFIGKYFTQGKKAAVAGRITTGSYTNKEGQKIYTTDVLVDEIDFADSNNAGQAQQTAPPVATAPPQFAPQPMQTQAPQVYNQAPMPQQAYAPQMQQQYAQPVQQAYAPQPQAYYQPQQVQQPQPQPNMDFMKIPDSIKDDELPFN